MNRVLFLAIFALTTIIADRVTKIARRKKKRKKKNGESGRNE